MSIIAPWALSDDPWKEETTKCRPKFCGRQPSVIVSHYIARGSFCEEAIRVPTGAKTVGALLSCNSNLGDAINRILAGEALARSRQPPAIGRMVAIVTFWVTVFLIQKLNWLGVYKALLLAALLLSVPMLFGVIRRRLLRQSVAQSRGMMIATALAMGAQLVYFGLRVTHPHLIDVATTTLGAATAMLRGENPYLLPIDAVSGGLGDRAFHGYKYLPMMAIAYLPLGTLLGERGILITNLVLHLGVAWAVWRLASRAGTTASGQLAVLLYLSLPLVAMQVLAKGATDLVAVAPLLLALLCLEENATAAGVCVGLSISAKLLPGMVFLPCLLPAARADRVRYALGIALGLIPALPFVLWSPAAFADNVVLFALLRPADTTSWLAAMSGDVALLARLVGAAVFCGVAAYVWRRPPSLIQRCGLGAMLAMTALLAGGRAHHNYQLWWLPFYCVLLGTAVSTPVMSRSVRSAARIRSAG